jgi:hypothetical protein
VEDLMNVQKKEHAQSVEATKIRDEKMDVLDTWASDFKNNLQSSFWQK